MSKRLANIAFVVSRRKWPFGCPILAWIPDRFLEPVDDEARRRAIDPTCEGGEEQLEADEIRRHAAIVRVRAASRNLGARRPFAFSDTTRPSLETDRPKWSRPAQ